MFAVKRYARGSTPVARPVTHIIFDVGARSRLFPSQDFGTLGIRRFYLVTLPRHSRKATGAQICVDASLLLSGALRMRVVAECSAALTRLS
jgi:hypothetical protein